MMSETFSHLSPSAGTRKSQGRRPTSQPTLRVGRRRMSLHAALSFFIYLSSSLGALGRPRPPLPPLCLYQTNYSLFFRLSVIIVSRPLPSSPPVSFRDVTRSRTV